MSRFKKAEYIINEGDEIEIHFMLGGFDHFIKGDLTSFVPSQGILIENEEGDFFIPMGNVLYFKKNKNKEKQEEVKQNWE